MDFTFINWSEHLFAGFDTVEMQDSVSEVFYRADLCHESIHVFKNQDKTPSTFSLNVADRWI